MSSSMDIASKSGRFGLTMASRAWMMCFKQWSEEDYTFDPHAWRQIRGLDSRREGVALLVGSALVAMLPRCQSCCKCGFRLSFDPHSWVLGGYAHALQKISANPKPWKNTKTVNSMSPRL